MEEKEPIEYTFARIAHKATLVIRPEVSGDYEYWRIRQAIVDELIASDPPLSNYLKDERMKEINGVLRDWNYGADNVIKAKMYYDLFGQVADGEEIQTNQILFFSENGKYAHTHTYIYELDPPISVTRSSAIQPQEGHRRILSSFPADVTVLTLENENKGL